MTDEQHIDWDRLEPDYRAGVLSLRYLAAKYGCSLGAITRRAKRDGWRRVLVAPALDHGENTTEAGENRLREHLTGENTQTARENTLREHPVRENAEREHPETLTTGENGDGENTEKENSRENSSGLVISRPEAGENKKENTGENSETGCSLTADPEREQPRLEDRVTPEMEYRAAQQRYGHHVSGCRLAAGGGRCPQCLALSTQRDITYQRFRHAQYLR
jgi:hypothetical protein